jgi:hypothetical protein
VSYLFFWRAKAQRRKEIGENLSDLPEAGRLFVNLFFGVQRKTLCVLASLRANFFFSRQEGKTCPPRRTGAKKLDKPLASWRGPLIFCRAKAQRRKEKTLGGLASLRANFFFFPEEQRD